MLLDDIVSRFLSYRDTESTTQLAKLGRHIKEAEKVGKRTRPPLIP